MRTLSMAAVISLLLGTGGLAVAADAQPAPPAATAPSTEEPQTITTVATAQNGPHLTGWFVAPTFGTTGFGGNLSTSPGLRAGIYLNRNFAVGLTGNGLFNGDTRLSKHEVKNLGSYGGLLLQYVLKSNDLVHATFETTLGEGRWCNQIYDGDDDDGKDGCVGRNFMVFEPVANLELNLARHVRLTTGVGYRFAVAGGGSGPSSREMSSLVARTGLLFGSF